MVSSAGGWGAAPGCPPTPSDMKLGTSMPRAWVKLAPLVPRGTPADCPETIFACELGQLAFS